MRVCARVKEDKTEDENAGKPPCDWDSPLLNLITSRRNGESRRSLQNIEIERDAVSFKSGEKDAPLPSLLHSHTQPAHDEKSGEGA